MVGVVLSLLALLSVPRYVTVGADAGVVVVVGCCDGAGDGDDTSSSSSSAPSIAIDDPSRPRRSAGGLRWRDLGVSLERCPSTTTALALDEYDTVSDDDGRGDRGCLAHSTWLLHPSSGFVEEGSLCGIIGPR